MIIILPENFIISYCYSKIKYKNGGIDMRKIKRRKNKVRTHVQIEKENIEKANDLGLNIKTILRKLLKAVRGDKNE
jgi:hypothetical protein